MAHSANWFHISTDSWVLAVVQNGYIVFFKDGPPRLSSTPRQIQLPSNLFTSCLLAEVQALQDKNAIAEVTVSFPGFYGHLCGTQDRRLETGYRSQLSQPVRSVPRFQMLTPRKLKTALRPGASLTFCRTPIFTFLSTYRSKIKIQDSRSRFKILRFAVQGKVWQFGVLPFGLSAAPFGFMRFMQATSAFYTQSHSLSVRLT